MNQGYIKLYRKVMDSFVWANPNLLKLWLLLLMKASHDGRKFLFNGQEIALTSGQLVTGAHALASELNEGASRDNQVSWRQVWRWVKKFENEEMLTIKSNSKYSVISINNWDEYQANDKPVSIGRQSNDKPVSTNKNEKNDKNEKNLNNNTSKKSKKRIYPDDDPNKKLAVALLKLIKKNQNIKDPDLDSWANTIRLTIEADGRTGREVQDMIIWSTQHEFWSGVVLSASSLRRNFDKMMAQKNKKTFEDHIPEIYQQETGLNW